MEHNTLATEPAPEFLADLNDLQFKAQEHAQDTRAMGDPKPPKKGRGRPKKIKTEEPVEGVDAGADPGPQTVDPMAQMFANQFCTILSNTAVSVTGLKECAMTPETRLGIEPLTTAMIMKYAPQTLSKWGLEIAFAGALGAYGFQVYQCTENAIAERVKEQMAQERRHRDEQARESIHTAHSDLTASHFPLVSQ